jgi:hypothetical protein
MPKTSSNEGAFLVSETPHIGKAQGRGTGGGGGVLADPTVVLTSGRRVLGGTDEHSRSARADPNASQLLCHALLLSMPLTSVVELRDPFLLGWGVGRILRP